MNTILQTQMKAVPSSSFTPIHTGLLQRKCAGDECAERHKKRLTLQRSSTNQASTVPPIVHKVLRSPGQPLDQQTRAFMELRFGHDFNKVRVHTDTKAAESALAVNAHAYTVGHDIVFDTAQLAPGTYRGQWLLAHELAHTIQQELKPLVTRGGLSMNQRGDLSEREATAVAAAVMQTPSPSAIPSTGVKVNRLTPTMPVVARQPAPKPAAPVPCTINCTDPTFLALSPSAREAQLNTQCPQGFPESGNTFFSQPIPVASSKVLSSKLLEAQSRAMRAMCLEGQDPNAFVLDRSITTYSTHSPAKEKAVDIDVMGQPYIMHEVSKGTPETEIDKEVGEIYNRIAFWSHYRKSIIPTGITSVSRPPKSSSTQRTWTNPRTGTKEPITTGELYDLLKEESTGMQGYFNLLLKSDADLTIEVEAFLVFNVEPLANLSKLGIPTDESGASMQKFRQRIADDYRLLGGSYAQLKAFAGKPIADVSKNPPARHGDRPFEGGIPAGSTLKSGAPNPAANRRPELGFISLPKEVVVALTEVGLIWGAIDFGGASGDVMHFDCRKLPGC